MGLILETENWNYWNDVKKKLKKLEIVLPLYIITMHYK